MPSRAHREIALAAVLTRVRWYASRRYAIPGKLAEAFNALADELGVPNEPPWTRIELR